MGVKSSNQVKTIRLQDGTAGKTLRIKGTPVGSGKQGAVYVKQARGNASKQAVKIFHGCSRDAEECIKKLTTVKFPKNLPICRPKKWFRTEGGQFGYVMDLKKEGYVEYKDLLRILSEQGSGSIELPNLLILCRIGYGLAEIVDCIHEMGWVFPDLSENNFAFHPKNGTVVLFDTDNLREISEAASGNIAIRGTYGSMAPELVLGQTYPNVHSDNFALASVIFQMFLHHYPYDGKAMMEEINDAEYYRKYHGTDPVFIFSRSRRDRALPKIGYYEKMWDEWEHVIPTELRAMFSRTFETGAKQPQNRPSAKEWMALFGKLAGRVSYCPECRHEMFTEGMIFDCPVCRKKSRIPYLMVHANENTCRIPFYKNLEISAFEIEGKCDKKRDFLFHDGVRPIIKVAESNGKPYLVNLDPREKTWICAYGPIEQSMEYGDGNLLAKNVCVRIPMEQGEWVITMGEQ